MGDESVGSFELGTANSSLQICKAIIESWYFHIVVGGKSSVSKQTRSFISANQHATFACGDNFVAIERIATNVSWSDPESFTGVLDNRDIYVFGDLSLFPIQMYDNNGFRSEGYLLPYLIPVD